MGQKTDRGIFMDTELKEPWFEEGLRFKCTGCGGCCTGSPGYVYLSANDIDTLAHHFNLSRDEFTKKHTRFVDGSYALLDKKGSNDCAFLKDKQCTVQPQVAPLQQLQLDERRRVVPFSK